MLKCKIALAFVSIHLTHIFTYFIINFLEHEYFVRYAKWRMDVHIPFAHGHDSDAGA